MKKQAPFYRSVVLGFGMIIAAGMMACNFAQTDGSNAKIKVTEFEAYMIDDVAFISFVTSSEKRNQKWTLERSGNGRDFHEVKTFHSNGKESMYTYVDNDPKLGLSYYRIKQAVKHSDNAIAPLINHDHPDELNIQTDGPVITVEPDHAHDKTYLVSLSDETGKHYFLETITFSSANPLVINTAEIGLPSMDYIFHLHSTDYSTNQLISL